MSLVDLFAKRHKDTAIGQSLKMDQRKSHQGFKPYGGIFRQEQNEKKSSDSSEMSRIVERMIG